MSLRRLQVAASRPYPVWVGDEPGMLADALRSVGVQRASAVALLTDSNLEAVGHAGRARAVLEELGLPVVQLTVPAGEDSKSLQVYGAQLEAMAAAGLDRQAWVCAVGGGVVGDLAGFLAASYLRGLDWVQLPTSLLAMVDASVGGKTGLDLAAGKNLVGAIWQPSLVVADTRVLATLPDGQLRGGAMEVYKHGLISDAPWRRQAFHHPDGAVGLRAMTAADWVELVAANVQVKAEVVAQDEREGGVRAYLNLGHTLAHALETLSDHAMSHGTAVAYGLAYAALLGRARGWVDWTEDMRRVAAWAVDTPLPTLPFPAVLAAMAQDKKRQAGRPRFVLLRELGRPELVADLSDDELADAWSELPALFQGGSA